MKQTRVTSAMFVVFGRLMLQSFCLSPFPDHLVSDHFGGNLNKICERQPSLLIAGQRFRRRCERNLGYLIRKMKSLIISADEVKAFVGTFDNSQ